MGRRKRRRDANLRDRDALPKLQRRMQGLVEDAFDQIRSPSSDLAAALDDLEPTMEELRADYANGDMRDARAMADHVIGTLNEVMEMCRQERYTDLARRAETLQDRMKDIRDQLISNRRASTTRRTRTTTRRRRTANQDETLEHALGNIQSGIYQAITDKLPRDRVSTFNEEKTGLYVISTRGKEPEETPKRDKKTIFNAMSKLDFVKGGLKFEKRGTTFGELSDLYYEVVFRHVNGPIFTLHIKPYKGNQVLIDVPDGVKVDLYEGTDDPALGDLRQDKIMLETGTTSSLDLNAGDLARTIKDMFRGHHPEEPDNDGPEHTYEIRNPGQGTYQAKIDADSKVEAMEEFLGRPLKGDDFEGYEVVKVGTRRTRRASARDEVAEDIIDEMEREMGTEPDWVERESRGQYSVAFHGAIFGVEIGDKKNLPGGESWYRTTIVYPNGIAASNPESAADYFSRFTDGLQSYRVKEPGRDTHEAIVEAPGPKEAVQAVLRRAVDDLDRAPYEAVPVKESRRQRCARCQRTRTTRRRARTERLSSPMKTTTY